VSYLRSLIGIVMGDRTLWVEVNPVERHSKLAIDRGASVRRDEGRG